MVMFLVIWLVTIGIILILFAFASALSAILESEFWDTAVEIIGGVALLWLGIGGGIMLISIALVLPEVLK